MSGLFFHPLPQSVEHLPIPDDEIVFMLTSASKKTEEEAVKLLLDSFQPVVLQIAGKLSLNRHSAVDTDSILHDAVMALVEKVKSGGFDPQKGNLTGLFTGIATNLVKQNLDKEYSRRKNEQKFAETDLFQEDHEYALLEENIERMERAIAKLNSKEQNLLIAYWYKDEPLKAIADKAGKTAEAIRQYHKRTLDKLRTYFKNLSNNQNGRD